MHLESEQTIRVPLPVRWQIDPRLTRPGPVDPNRVLRALRDLAVANGGDFVPAHNLVSLLGQSPGLGVALENLLAQGFTERGGSAQGGWGDRPTVAGYTEAARLDQLKAREQS
jgi:hypothetical protein